MMIKVFADAWFLSTCAHVVWLLLILLWCNDMAGLVEWCCLFSLMI